MVIPFAATAWLRNGPVPRPGEGDEGVGIVTTQQGELLRGHGHGLVFAAVGCCLYKRILWLPPVMD